MYLTANVAIDPMQLSKLRRKPTKGFRRFAEILTANLLSRKEEEETFTALSILQEIHIVLRSMGVTDLLRFTKDDITLYEDRESNDTDDVQQAIRALGNEGDAPFRELRLVLEHHLPTIVIVIEVCITRVHEIGIYPILITINGLDAELKDLSENEQDTSDLLTTEESQSSSTSMPERSALRERMENVFQSQSTYDDYVQGKRKELEKFVEQLEEAIRSKMMVQNLRKHVSVNVLRPSSASALPTNSRQESERLLLLRRRTTAPTAMHFSIFGIGIVSCERITRIATTPRS